MGRGTDGLIKATGKARYVADAVPRPCYFAGLLRSRSAHSWVRVDREGLRALPGIECVLDYEDEPGMRFSTNPHHGTVDTQIFAREAHHAGDIVGAIAATDRASLRAALAKAPEFILEQPLPAVLSMDAALHGVGLANELYPGNMIVDARIGEPEAVVREAIDAASYQLSSTVHIDPTPHSFLEPLAAGAHWDGGQLHIWSPTQCPGLVRDKMAELFDAEVTLEPVFLGGGFGGKEELTLEPAAAALSKALGGSPVLLETSRRDMTTSYRTRHGGSITVTTGFDIDGIFQARWIEVLLEGGPYDGHTSSVTRNAGETAARLYPRGIVGARARGIATNRVPGGAYRGYGGTQGIFAVESHVDEIAALIGLDPWELRRRNAAASGDVDPGSGAALRDARAAECLQMLANLKLPALPEPEVSYLRTGRGLSLLVNTSAAPHEGEPDSAEVACVLDTASGKLTIETSVAEAGQGIYPALATVVAGALGFANERIEVLYCAMSGAPKDPGMFGSRGANVTASAALRGALMLRDEVVRQGAEHLDTSPQDIAIDPDWDVFRSRATGLEAKLAELNPIRVVGSYSTDDPGMAFGVQQADVTCDLRTGEVRVLRMVAVHDVGVVLDLDGATAQVEGGVLQAVGGALSERISFRADGTIAETGFVNHLMPTAVNRPEVSVHFLEAVLEAGPRKPDRTGAKGIGEAAVLGGAAAIANAVADATGVRVRIMPLTGERVLRAVSAVHPGGEQA